MSHQLTPAGQKLLRDWGPRDEMEGAAHADFRDAIQRVEWQAIERVFPGLGDADVARALLYWYDTTHGNEFGHDHHCVGSRVFAERWTSMPEDCSCGWTEVLKAEERRDQLASGAVV